MLKFKIKKGSRIRVKANGTAKDLMNETAMVIAIIYNSIYRNNPEAAAEYKLNLLGVLLDPKSPVWEIEEGTE